MNTFLWIILSLFGIIALYILLRIMSAAIFSTWFELKAKYLIKEKEDGTREIGRDTENN